MGRSTPPALFLMISVLVAGRSIAAPALEIPFRIVNGFITIEGQVEHSTERLNLLLDSGASVSVLSERTARHLGVFMGAPETVRGVASEAVAYRVKDVRARARGIELGEMQLAADLSAADELCGERIDGLIGTQFFRDRIVQIDFASQRIRLLSKVRRRAIAVQLPLRLRNDVPCAAVSVNGCAPRWARVDTGCNEPLHWVVPRRAGDGRTLGSSIGFVSQPEYLALVSISLGSLTFPGTEAVLHGHELFPGECGLLGTGVLARFTRVTLDWPGRALLLENSRDLETLKACRGALHPCPRHACSRFSQPRLKSQLPE
jgi:hypothetical protein